MTKVSRDWLLAIAVVCAGVIYTLPVRAQGPGGLNVTPTIRVCVQNGNNQLRLIGPFETCARNEQMVTWNIVGPQGPKGNVGPQGPQGNIGPVGPMGLQGFRGNIGPAGPQGDIGLIGPPGKQGFPGNIGPAGPQGDIGLTGKQGFPGNIGPAGPQGDIGLTGKQGFPGNIGPAGPQGDIGLTGKQGFPGNIGPAGPTGPQGPPGDPGTAFVGGRAIGLVLDSCNMTPYVGFVTIPGSSHVSWTDATGHFDLFQIIPGNYTLAFPYVNKPPDKAVHFDVQAGQTTDLGAILIGFCQAANDPCVNGTNVCDTDATCRLVGPTTYTCTCNKGFAGDGTTCNPINVCLSNPCDPHAACSFTGPGTFACTCQPGYTGNGFTCAAINACTNNDCADIAKCTVTGPATYVCSCPVGYQGDGKTCTPVNGSASGPAPPVLPVGLR